MHHCVDRYLALVQGPFGNNTLFQKVLKEVFLTVDMLK
jgi:hypothetical protein